MKLRLARPTDVDAATRLLRRSYPALLAADYAADVLDACLPGMTRAKPELLASGRYFVVEAPDGALAALGGWSAEDPRKGFFDGLSGHIRHVATDPDHLRRGLARDILDAIFEQAQRATLQRMSCLSTLTAVPFYRSVGFAEISRQAINLRGGGRFNCVEMGLNLP